MSQPNPTQAALKLRASCMGALLDNLAGLRELLKQLDAAAARKLTGLRTADVAVLHDCARQEASLLERVTASRRERNAILARVAQELRWPAARSATLSQISERLDEPFSSRFQAGIAGLREIALSLEKKNHTNARVAHNLQTCVREVFAEMAKSTQETVVYDPKGQHHRVTNRSWMDAVG